MMTERMVTVGAVTILLRAGANLDQLEAAHQTAREAYLPTRKRIVPGATGPGFSTLNNDADGTERRPCCPRCGCEVQHPTLPVCVSCLAVGVG